MTAVIAPLSAAVQAGHMNAITVICVVAAVVLCSALAAIVAIVRIRSQPDVQRVTILRKVLRKAESPQERRSLVACVLAAEALTAKNHRTVVPLLNQALTETLPEPKSAATPGAGAGGQPPVMTDGVTQMHPTPPKGHPGAA
jgi:hypothetical protein